MLLAKQSQESTITKADYSARDRNGKVAFYVLLWKRKGISLELFDDYWRDVHGPVCARLPGQHQYWQFHVAHN
ncbi:MAG: EthD domain-containing protein, partial [Phormidium sp.]